jgi:hypothetical protein
MTIDFVDSLFEFFRRYVVVAGKPGGAARPFKKRGRQGIRVGLNQAEKSVCE